MSGEFRYEDDGSGLVRIECEVLDQLLMRLSKLEGHVAELEAENAVLKAEKTKLEAENVVLKAENTALQVKVCELSEQLNRNSTNSSKPPSSDGFGQDGRQKQPKREKGKGFKGEEPKKSRQLYPVESCIQVFELKPETCQHCGSALKGNDGHPQRHQVIEIPPIVPIVTEYRLHQLCCEQCQQSTQASLPVGVSPCGYGEHVSGIVGLLSGQYRQSYRQVCRLMEELFSVPMSRGGVGRLRQELSEALSHPVAQAKQYVQSAAVLHSDETSFPQGNRDGANPSKAKGWIWGLVTPLVCFFEVVLSRSQATAQRLIGESFEGILVTDRYSAYHWLPLEQRQLCWAHLKRDLQAIVERGGASKEIGEALLSRQRRLFQWWHRVRDGTLSRETFQAAVTHLRAGFKAQLEEAAALPLKRGESNPLAKTIRTCRKLLKVEAALWTFVAIPGVEPTNNAAERALRPAVIWRRTSFGSQSQGGSEFVAQMLTVTASLKAQHRSPLDFLTQACHAARHQLPPPSLLPPRQASLPLDDRKLLLTA